MMENRGISAIIFDLDNTLVDTAGAGRVAIQKVCELLKSAPVQENHIKDICDRFLHKLLHETFDPSGGTTIDDVRIQHWREALRETRGTDPDPALASGCYYTWKKTRLQVLSLSPEVRSLLEELQKSYKLLLLTNGDAQTQWEKVEAVRCEGLFSAVVVGGDHPWQKPSLSIFTRCFEMLGVKPQDCVMVGDSLSTDIQGGINAGMRATVWINSDGKCIPQSHETPDFTIPSVMKLTDVLAELS